MNTTKYGSLFLLLVLLSAKASAAPITYTYTGTWFNVIGTLFGSNYTATVVFDNGGTDPANQTFVQADFVSATLVSGSYNFTMTDADFSIVNPWLADFASNASGQLTTGAFNADNGNNSWSFNTTGLNTGDFTNLGDQASGFSSNTSAPGGVASTATATSVPTMSAYGLVLTMLGLLAVAGRRLRASAKRK